MKVGDQMKYYPAKREVFNDSEAEFPNPTKRMAVSNPALPFDAYVAHVLSEGAAHLTVTDHWGVVHSCRSVRICAPNMRPAEDIPHAVPV